MTDAISVFAVSSVKMDPWKNWDEETRSWNSVTNFWMSRLIQMARVKADVSEYIPFAVVTVLWQYIHPEYISGSFTARCNQCSSNTCIHRIMSIHERCRVILAFPSVACWDDPVLWSSVRDLASRTLIWFPKQWCSQNLQLWIFHMANARKRTTNAARPLQWRWVLAPARTGSNRQYSICRRHRGAPVDLLLRRGNVVNGSLSKTARGKV